METTGRPLPRAILYCLSGGALSLFLIVAAAQQAEAAPAVGGKGGSGAPVDLRKVREIGKGSEERRKTEDAQRKANEDKAKQSRQKADRSRPSAPRRTPTAAGKGGAGTPVDWNKIRETGKGSEERRKTEDAQRKAGEARPQAGQPSTTTPHRSPAVGGKGGSGAPVDWRKIRELARGSEERRKAEQAQRRKDSINNPRDHFVGNVADEARETSQEIPAALEDLVQSVRDANAQSKPWLYTGDEYRVAQERNRQRGDAIAGAVQNPREAVGNIVRPYTEDLNSDQPERVIGRAAVDIVGTLLSGGGSLASKGAKGADALSGGRRPDPGPQADSPPRPGNEPGGAGPATGGSPSGDSPPRPNSAPRVADQQSPHDRAGSGPTGSRGGATTPRTPSSSSRERGAQDTTVLPAPVTQLPTLPRAHRGDSPARRTPDTSRKDTSGDDDSRTGPLRRDTGIPSSRRPDSDDSRRQSSDRTPASGTGASPAARPTAKGADRCPTNSFPPGTLVLMADGTRKPIESVRVGEFVAAKDPATGRSGARTVAGLIAGSGDKDLVELTVDTDGDAGDETAVIVATDRHPFWNDSARQWVDAEDFVPGQRLQARDGHTLAVVGTRHRAARQTVHNLSITDINTYYVLAGDTPVLVHNAGCATPGDGPPSATADAASTQKTEADTARAKNTSKGRLGEKFVKRVKNTRSIDGTTKDRIPDFLDDQGLGEMKNVKKLHLSSQLQDFMKYAEKHRIPFILYVRPDTKLTGPLLEAIAKHPGAIVNKFILS